MKVLGINGFCFDASAALVVDGRPVFYAEEERFNREKKTKEFPAQALESSGASPEDIDAVVCPWDPWKGFVNSVRIALANFPASLTLLLPWSSTDCNMVYGTNILSMRKALSRAFPVRRDVPFHYLDHHACHAALAFFTSPFDEADVLVMDGFGDDCSLSVFEAAGTSMKRVRSNRMFDSLGLLYSVVTRHLGFAPYREEGTVMGLAAHGDARFVEEFGRVVRLSADGSYALDRDWLSFEKYGEIRPFTERFLAVFGPPRQRDEPLDERHRALARALQETVERALLHVTRAMAARSRSKRLCFAGGVALNCLANGRIARESGYEAVFVPAAPGDGGTSLGAALYYSHVMRGLPRVVREVSPYLGCEYDDAQIRREVESAAGARVRRVDDVADEAARLVSAGKVVGWFQGRAEMGPRALGARSVLADPRSSTVAARLNGEMKKREAFRPFAPSVLAGRASEVFEGTSPSPYMSFASPVRSSVRARVPAVMQVDGTARLHTVEPEPHPRYHRLLTRFEELTGLPLVLNTSFNRQAPIVETPAHALAAFREMGLDALAIGDWIVEPK